MTRLVRIVERAGRAEARSFVLAKSKVLIGRSRTADLQVQDPAVSGRHFEISLDADGVFIENISEKGTLLNGKPLTAMVSLAHGDQIVIGSTKLRYEETDEPVAAGDSAPPQASGSASRAAEHGASAGGDPDETQPFDRPPDLEGESDENPGGKTRPIGNEKTRVAPQGELGDVVSGRARQSTGTRVLMVFLVLGALLASLSAFVWMGREKPLPQGEVSFEDAAYGFRVTYPAAWSKFATQPELFEVGIGDPQDPEYARVRFQIERGQEVEDSGLTAGFAGYLNTLKRRLPEFGLVGESRRLNLSTLTVEVFEFETPKVRGLGMFVPDGRSRYLIECTCRPDALGRYRNIFLGVMDSFRLLSERQEFIDFPASTAAQRQLALTSTNELQRMIAECHLAADQLIKTREVNPQNLYLGITKYRAALQLAAAGRPRLDGSYPQLAAGLRDATRTLNQEIDKQLYELRRAVALGDVNKTVAAANRLVLTIPEPQHLAYREAKVALKNARLLQDAQ